jgi:alanine-glyoxylate transaminase/serine-glyoxylate transaminase/serine-pyruvate transaminase
LNELERITHKHGALFVVDAVCGLGGVPMNVDEMKIDACYAGSQKSLGALPGLAPVTLNERAVEVIRNRKTLVQSYYLDLPKLHRYWNGDHTYHHTACSNVVYTMHEALRIVLEEGLETRWARHRLNGEALRAGIKAMGLDILTQPGYELPVLTAVSLREGIDEVAIRKALLEEYSIEIGGGFGALKGRLIRIGLMGYNSCRKNVDTVLAALEHLAPRCGFQPEAGAALAAADEVYKKA